MSTSSAGSLQGHYAGFASRLVAVAIDVSIMTAITVVVSWASLSLLDDFAVDLRNCPPIDSGVGRGALLCFAFRWAGIIGGATFPSVYLLFFWATTGQSPGKAVMGVRVVRLDGRPMNLWTGMVRLFGYSISMATFGLGFLLALPDDRRQALHDKIARTCVIYSWEAHGDPDLRKLFPRLFG